jgi:hypothetical protein
VSGTFCQAKSLAGATYVGAKTCKECHQGHFDGWKSTLHPYKFQKATPEVIVGDFIKNTSMTVDDKPTTMARKGDDFFVTTADAEGKDQTYKVDYVIGGFWKQLYVTKFPNGELHILPPMWIVKSQTWKNTKNWKKGTVYQNGCSGCHNTGTRINYDESTKTYNTTWADLGVSCEACHGPGSIHVEADKDAKAETIINPAKIPDPRRAAMVCGACHTRGSCCDGKYGYPKGYTPGGQLNFMFSEKPKLHPAETSRANRQEYIDWKKSGHAREGVVCWHCHYTHQQGTSNKYQTRLPGSSLCRSCHQVGNVGVHGIHSVNNCVGCHMPAIGKRATKGDVHSHQFKVISPKLSMDAGGIDKQPNSCNACHYHKNDKPEKLLKVLKQVKLSRKERIFK